MARHLAQQLATRGARITLGACVSMASAVSMLTMGAAPAQGQTPGVQRAQPADDAVPAGWRLERAVIVMRHGVRAATDTPKMDAASAQPWPAFEVADGQLTPHGYQAVTLLGKWERGYFTRTGLLDDAACADASQTFVWSSPAARTQATAQALLDGLFPGCKVPVGHATTATDTLFHGDALGLGTPDPVKAREAIRHAMGSPEAARERYAQDVALMVSAVGAPQDCVAAHGIDACGLNAKPWGVKDDGDKAGLSGPVSVGAGMSETIRMQYADGWPIERIAFGHVRNGDDVLRLMGLRSAKYDLVNHTPYLARRGGSQLLSQVVLAIDSDKPVKGAPPPAKLTVFVAHDTNISQLRAMLGFDWQIGNYRENDAVPGGTLLFERFVRTRDGKRFVRVSYVAQSLEQMRALTPLDDAQGPLRAVYRLTPSAAVWMPLPAFVTRAQGSIDRTAIAPQSYVSVVK